MQYHKRELTRSSSRNLPKKARTGKNHAGNPGVGCKHGCCKGCQAMSGDLPRIPRGLGCGMFQGHEFFMDKLSTKGCCRMKWYGCLPVGNRMQCINRRQKDFKSDWIFKTHISKPSMYRSKWSAPKIDDSVLNKFKKTTGPNYTQVIHNFSACFLFLVSKHQPTTANNGHCARAVNQDISALENKRENQAIHTASNGFFKATGNSTGAFWSTSSRNRRKVLAPSTLLAVLAVQASPAAKPLNFSYTAKLNQCAAWGRNVSCLSAASGDMELLASIETTLSGGSDIKSGLGGPAAGGSWRRRW